jgi:hypothetical protein
VFAGGIIRRSIKRSDRPLTCRAALELVSHFLTAALFQRIGTPGSDKSERANDPQALHPLILGNNASNATTWSSDETDESIEGFAIPSL